MKVFISLLILNMVLGFALSATASGSKKNLSIQQLKRHFHYNSKLNRDIEVASEVNLLNSASFDSSHMIGIIGDVVQPDFNQGLTPFTDKN